MKHFYIIVNFRLLCTQIFFHFWPFLAYFIFLPFFNSTFQLISLQCLNDDGRKDVRKRMIIHRSTTRSLKKSLMPNENRLAAILIPKSKVSLIKMFARIGLKHRKWLLLLSFRSPRKTFPENYFRRSFKFPFSAT